MTHSPAAPAGFAVVDLSARAGSAWPAWLDAAGAVWAPAASLADAAAPRVLVIYDAAPAGLAAALAAGRPLGAAVDDWMAQAARLAELVRHRAGAVLPAAAGALWLDPAGLARALAQWSGQDLAAPPPAPPPAPPQPAAGAAAAAPLLALIAWAAAGQSGPRHLAAGLAAAGPAAEADLPPGLPEAAFAAVAAVRQAGAAEAAAGLQDSFGQELAQLQAQILTTQVLLEEEMLSHAALRARLESFGRGGPDPLVPEYFPGPGLEPWQQRVVALATETLRQRALAEAGSRARAAAEVRAMQAAGGGRSWRHVARVLARGGRRLAPSRP